MNKFRPLKAPNDCVSFKFNEGKIYAGDLTYPILTSEKLDGLRCVLYKGEMLSCSLKSIVNKQVREKFLQLAKYSKERNMIIDGEFYCSELNFQQIISMIMTKDYTDKKAIKKWQELCEEIGSNISRKEALDFLKFYCFDCVKEDNFNEPFIERVKELAVIEMNNQFLVKRVLNIPCKNKEEVENLFNKIIAEGGEGLILRSFKGRYKFGRATLNENIIYKVKKFETFDAKILEIIQATKVDPNAEKKINQLGRSVTSKKQKDRILINKASAFLVEYEGKPVKVVIAMTNEEKVEIWANRRLYKGKYIEYRGMIIGSKLVPRHATLTRMRPDKI